MHVARSRRPRTSDSALPGFCGPVHPPDRMPATSSTVPVGAGPLVTPGLAFLLARARPFAVDADGIVLLAVAALGLTSLFGLLRAALLHSVPSRVLELTRGERRRQRVRPLLERAESLATSASVFWITSQILFVVFVWVHIGRAHL